MKLLVHSIQGPENAVNGVFPIGIASMAAEAGHEVNIFLAGNAVSLMKTEIVENMSAIGVGKLSDYMKVIKACTMWVCLRTRATSGSATTRCSR